MRGIEAIDAQVWTPLLRAVSRSGAADLIVAGGSYEERDYVATVGHYCGTFREDWLTIPATGRPVYIRFGEVHEVRDGRIVQTTASGTSST